ncbi:RNA-directed DNA polymerase from mobile element jockey [Willisornis vidua]|uniref:RNA-directed DNA polymerase from mobile element jockey n=1 Tax=Willisornis vidua TaxID=1566151 RepID=A0ABQ9CQY2_9PASS|nr:RNA-directed DNA polymerase from mobile element jockey [Willisornis vidua]
MGSRVDALSIQGKVVSDLLCHLDIHKSMGPNGIHLRTWRELEEELKELLSVIYPQSWLTREVPEDWRLAHVMPIYKKDWKGDLGNYRPVRVTLMPGKVMEQIFWSAVM